MLHQLSGIRLQERLKQSRSYENPANRFALKKIWNFGCKINGSLSLHSYTVAQPTARSATALFWNTEDPPTRFNWKSLTTHNKSLQFKGRCLFFVFFRFGALRYFSDRQTTFRPSNEPNFRTIVIVSPHGFICLHGSYGRLTMSIDATGIGPIIISNTIGSTVQRQN